MSSAFVDNDLATVWPAERRGGQVVAILYRGDEVEVLARYFYVNRDPAVALNRLRREEIFRN